MQRTRRFAHMRVQIVRNESPVASGIESKQVLDVFEEVFLPCVFPATSERGAFR